MRIIDRLKRTSPVELLVATAIAGTMGALIVPPTVDFAREISYRRNATATQRCERDGAVGTCYVLDRDGDGNADHIGFSGFRTENVLIPQRIVQEYPIPSSAR